MKVLGVIFLIYVVFPACFSRPTGAPTMVCQSMTPCHVVGPQNVSAPYIITADLILNTTDDDYFFNVTINSTDSAPFRGFLLQARPSLNEKPFGKWETTINNTKAIDCHSDKNMVIKLFYIVYYIIKEYQY